MKAFELRSYDGHGGLTPVDAPQPQPSVSELLLDVRTGGVQAQTGAAHHPRM